MGVIAGVVPGLSGPAHRPAAPTLVAPPARPGPLVDYAGLAIARYALGSAGTACTA